MKLSLVIEAVDKASQRVKRITGNVRDLGTRGMGVVQRATQGANRQLGRFGSGFAGRVTGMAAAARHFAGRMGLKAIETSAYGAGYAIGWTIRKGAALAGAALRWGAAGASFAAGWGIGGIIRTASQFEQFQVILENTEGSAAKARKAMAWVKDFAKTTPYEVGDVMEAFVRLRAYGVDPTNGSLRALGNMASGMGKQIMDAVEMLADAQTGEFERLKEFGVRASVEGKKVTLSYLKNGKDIRKTVALNAAAIGKAIQEISDDRFAGMMDRQSRTLSGMWSNLQDMVANFQLDVANAGFFDVVKGKVQQLLDKVNQLAANGTLATWAEKISGWLSDMTEKAAAFVANTDWQGVARDLKNVGTVLWWIFKAIAAIGGIVGDVASSVGWLGDKLGWLKNNRTSDLIGLTAPRRQIPFSAPSGGGRAWPSRMSDSLRPVAPRRVPNSPAIRQRQPVAWPEGYRSGRNASAAPMKGEVTVKVEAAPGTRARVAGASSSSGMSLSATSRGRAMESFA